MKPWAYWWILWEERSTGKSYNRHNATPNPQHREQRPPPLSLPLPHQLPFWSSSRGPSCRFSPRGSSREAPQRWAIHCPFLCWAIVSPRLVAYSSMQPRLGWSPGLPLARHFTGGTMSTLTWRHQCFKPDAMKKNPAYGQHSALLYMCD